MASQAIRQLRWAGGSVPEVFHNAGVKETNSQSFIKGDLVTIVPGTGTVSEYVVNGINIGGIALDNATNVTTGNIAIRIQKIMKDQVFIANVTNGATATEVTAITQLGKCYGLYTSAAGVWKVDVGNSTSSNCRVKVIGFVEGTDIDADGNPYTKAIGDAAGEVYIKFLSSDGVGTDAATNDQILEFDA
jgi:hypothetical protein